MLRYNVELLRGTIHNKIQGHLENFDLDMYRRAHITGYNNYHTAKSKTFKWQISRQIPMLGVICIAYDDFKDSLRGTFDEKLSPQHNLLKFLEGIGGEDKASLKCNVLEELTQYRPQSDAEAKLLIEEAKKILQKTPKQQHEVVELSDTTPSHRNSSSSEE